MTNIVQNVRLRDQRPDFHPHESALKQCQVSVWFDFIFEHSVFLASVHFLFWPIRSDVTSGRAAISGGRIAVCLNTALICSAEDCRLDMTVQTFDLFAGLQSFMASLSAVRKVVVSLTLASDI